MSREPSSEAPEISTTLQIDPQAQAAKENALQSFDSPLTSGPIASGVAVFRLGRHFYEIDELRAMLRTYRQDPITRAELTATQQRAILTGHPDYTEAYQQAYREAQACADAVGVESRFQQLLTETQTLVNEPTAEAAAASAPLASVHPAPDTARGQPRGASGPTLLSPEIRRDLLKLRTYLLAQKRRMETPSGVGFFGETALMREMRLLKRGKFARLWEGMFSMNPVNEPQIVLNWITAIARVAAEHTTLLQFEEPIALQQLRALRFESVRDPAPAINRGVELANQHNQPDLGTDLVGHNYPPL
ncbi:MAG: hypothetical protein A3J38_01945 [Gammaproteobacteria bacterium RIFCSPHIGHO2_12_FULL_45_9]|nr:MAG: hypothetical protein A3J38_01945 [Gammaproteobacteria bacterium RIFCSPHIGHO2_12_FULL_45_9]